MNRAPLTPAGVVSLVPRSPRACSQALDIVSLVHRASSGDPTAVEQLEVLSHLLTIRAMAGAPTRESGGGADAVDTPAIASISDRRAA